MKPYPDNIIADIFGDKAPETLPSDFDASFEYVLIARFKDKPRYAQAMRLRYIDGLTLEAGGEVMNVNKERFRQIVVKAQRYIRQPEWIRFLRYGVQGVIRMSAAAAGDERELKLMPYIEIQARARFAQALDEAIRKQGLRDKLGIPQTFSELLSPYDGEQEDKKRNSLLNMTIQELDTSVRTYNCLTRAGYKYVRDIIEAEPAELKKVRNFGRKSIEEMLDKLGDIGLIDDERRMRAAMYGDEA